MAVSTVFVERLAQETLAADSRYLVINGDAPVGDVVQSRNDPVAGGRQVNFSIADTF
jgi:hypothetical protein